MRTHLENIVRLKIQRLADWKKDLGSELTDPRMTLEHERVPSASRGPAAPGWMREAWRYAPDYPDSYDGADAGGPADEPDERTAVLINHGRRSVYRRRLSSAGRKAVAATAIVGLVTAIVVMIMIFRNEASWPPSVATVQSEVATACQNPDVKSEPGQVNFACGKTTQQILWVFALMTSGNDPNFIDTKTGRQGLEPITPMQGGEVAASLNLHHPYSPVNPVDSLEVAARAINNIIGGATLIDANGNPMVQAGLESEPANCLRYTGSAGIVSRAGFPGLCAKPADSPAGQAALVADVYQKWVVGSSAKVARNAAVLFVNAKNPGDPRVQFILKHLPHSSLPS